MTKEMQKDVSVDKYLCFRGNVDRFLRDNKATLEGDMVFDEPTERVIGGTVYIETVTRGYAWRHYMSIQADVVQAEVERQLSKPRGDK